MQTTLTSLVESFATKYRGCVILKVNDGYRVFGKTYPTEYLAKKRIDLAYNIFNSTKIFK